MTGAKTGCEPGPRTKYLDGPKPTHTPPSPPLLAVPAPSLPLAVLPPPLCSESSACSGAILHQRESGRDRELFHSRALPFSAAAAALPPTEAGDTALFARRLQRCHHAKNGLGSSPPHTSPVVVSASLPSPLPAVSPCCLLPWGPLLIKLPPPPQTLPRLLPSPLSCRPSISHISLIHLHACASRLAAFLFFFHLCQNTQKHPSLFLSYDLYDIIAPTLLLPSYSCPSRSCTTAVFVSPLPPAYQPLPVPPPASSSS